MDEEYKMGNAVLGRSTQDNYLGVTFSADMKVSKECTKQYLDHIWNIVFKNGCRIVKRTQTS